MNDTSDIEKLLRSLKEEGVPTNTFRTNAKIRIINTVTSPKHFTPRYFGYSFGAALATVVLSVGTVYAAQTSNQTSKLYPVKVLSERAALTLSPTESLKTSVAQTIISRRISEVEDVQKHGSTREVEESISRFQRDVSSIQKRNDVSRKEIEDTLAEHKEVINEIHAKQEEIKKEEIKKEKDRPHEND